MNSNNTELHRKATATRAAFKRPAIWVMGFGWSLALCAGLVNVVAMQTLGTYVSHVTGSTTAIGLHIEGYHKGRHDFEPLGEACQMVLSFLFGAFLCGLLIDKTQVHLGGKSFYGVALVGNGLLLVLSVLLAPESKRVAACLAAVACGLQNAMCTSHFGAVVRTTHVTGTITDIGSTLGRMSTIFLRKGCRRSRLNVLERAEVGVDARKLLVLGPMWLSFLLGCVVGAYLGTWMKIYALLVPAAFTTSVGLSYMLFRRTFKRFFKGLLQDRLNQDVAEVDQRLNRTQQVLSELRKSNLKMSSPDASPAANSNPQASLDLEGLDVEFGHILDTIHQVEEDIEDLQSQSRQASPSHRSETSAAATSGAVGGQEGV